MLKRKHALDSPKKQQSPGVTKQRIARSNVQKELMVLRMMPDIIRKLKAHQIKADQIVGFRKMFGDLWYLMVDESKRAPTEEMNPILSILLRAQQTSSNVEDSNAINNEVQLDSVKKISRRHRLNDGNRLPLRLVKLRDDMTFPQRVLKVAAILIHESLSQKINDDTHSAPKRLGSLRKTRRHQYRIHKKQLIQQSGQDSAALRSKFIQPEAIMNAMRHKRSLKYADSTDNDDVAMNLLRSMIKPTNAKENKDDDDKDGDDYNYDDDADAKKTESKDKESGKKGDKHDEPTDQKKQTQQLKREQQTKQANFMKTEDYKDYAFDTTDTDRFDEDEDLLRSFYGQKRNSAYDDYEYGSFSDLMQLAAKHTLRAQREDKYLSRLHFDDYLNDDTKDYSEEDDYEA